MHRQIFTLVLLIFVFILAVPVYGQDDTKTNITNQTTIAQSISFELDTFINSIPEEYHATVLSKLNDEIANIPTQSDYVATAFRQERDLMEIVLVPKSTLLSGWDNINFDEFITVFVHTPINSQAKAIVDFAPSFITDAQQIPSDFYELPHQIQGQSTGHLFPWTKAQGWWAIQGWHSGALDFQPTNHGSSANYNTDFAVLASKAGTVRQGCGGDPSQTIIYVDHSDGTSGYLHLDKNSVPNNIIGRYVSQGTYLGHLYTGTEKSGNVCPYDPNYRFHTPCGCGYGIHLHYIAPSQSMSIQGISANTISASASVYNPPTYYSDNQRTDYGGNEAPANTNLVRNSYFNEGTNYWTLYNDIGWAVYNGILHFKKESWEQDYASINQAIPYAIPSGNGLELHLKLGNPSSVNKSLTIHVATGSGWDDYFQCPISLSPGAPLQEYVIRGRTNQNWSSARLDIGVGPADSIPDIQMDDVILKRYPNLVPSQTQCISPSSQTTWTFDGVNAPDGWTIGNHLISPKYTSGGIWYKISGNDPWVHGPYMKNISASNYRYLRILTAAQNNTTCGQIFFRPSNQGFSEVRSVTFNMIGDGKTRNYYLDMSQNANWAGNIQQLRFDPSCGGSYNPNLDNGFAIYHMQLTNKNPHDVNGDGNITPADAIYIINRVGSNTFALDLNADGEISELDADMVINKIGQPAQ